MKGLWVASIGTAVVALVILARLGAFLVDEDNKRLSLQPTSAWRTEHSCLSAYAEAARFAAEPDRNIYERGLYAERYINGLKVDPYHYPPQFLLVPGALQSVAGGYLEVRPVWFAFQLGLLALAMALIIRWVGGTTGRTMMLAAPVLFIAPTTLFTLQMGNFQLSALTLSVIGMIALTAQRAPVQAVGGLVLAYAALSKVFPGILCVYLLVTRRWRALGWTALGGVVLTVVTLAIYGTAPFDDFVHYQVPRLSSGEAFPQSEFPRVAASNQSFYGLLVKLRTLGVETLDIKTGLAVTSGYGLVVIALALALAWRRRDVAGVVESRFGELTIWLALLNLASLRSPFVGGPYGLIGTTWLAFLLMCAHDTLRGRLAWAAMFLFMFGGPMLIATPHDGLTTTEVALSLGVQVVAIGLNAWVCIGGLRRARQPILDAP